MRKFNREEAEALLRQRMEETRRRPFPDLLALIDSAETTAVQGSSGQTYQIEINAMWDDQAQSRLRVWGSIDDGGWRAFFNKPPWIQDFFAFPDGRTE